jgi:hypothetical protein
VNGQEYDQFSFSAHPVSIFNPRFSFHLYQSMIFTCTILLFLNYYYWISFLTCTIQYVTRTVKRYGYLLLYVKQLSSCTTIHQMLDTEVLTLPRKISWSEIIQMANATIGLSDTDSAIWLSIWLIQFITVLGNKSTWASVNTDAEPRFFQGKTSMPPGRTKKLQSHGFRHNLKQARNIFFLFFQRNVCHQIDAKRWVEGFKNITQPTPRVWTEIKRRHEEVFGQTTRLSTKWTNKTLTFNDGRAAICARAPTAWVSQSNARSLQRALLV